jgi:hypothetical protein
MLSSSDWAILVTFKKELEDIKALYAHPNDDIIIVKQWIEKRIKDIEIKDNDS